MVTKYLRMHGPLVSPRAAKPLSYEVECSQHGKKVCTTATPFAEVAQNAAEDFVWARDQAEAEIKRNGVTVYNYRSQS
jgi:hypothetical protein